MGKHVHNAWKTGKQITISLWEPLPLASTFFPHASPSDHLGKVAVTVGSQCWRLGQPALVGALAPWKWAITASQGSGCCSTFPSTPLAERPSFLPKIRTKPAPFLLLLIFHWVALVNNTSDTLTVGTVSFRVTMVITLTLAVCLLGSATAALDTMFN